MFFIDWVSNSEILKQLNKLEKRMIRRGLFHSSKAISTNSAILLEIETPNEKNDLVRMNDEYGRKLLPCETEADDVYVPNTIEFKDPLEYEENNYQVAGCSIKIENVSHTDQILSKDDNDMLIFLRGGIHTPTNQNVVIPGDVGYAFIVKKVCEQIPYIIKNSIIMSIKKI
jgi:hypothetical protein